jgi:hypothetical protein
MAIGNKITGALTSLFGGNEEEDTLPAAPLSVKPTSPSTTPEGVVDYGQMKLLLQQQIERLRNERPNRADEFLAFASGLGRPTKTGSFGESLGYANEALAKQSAESAKARAARQEMMLKYGIDLATLGVEEQKNILAVKAKSAAELAKYGQPIERSINTRVNSAGQTIVTYLTTDGYSVTYNMQNPLQTTVAKSPLTPGRPSPSPLPTSGELPATQAVTPPLTQPSAAAKPTFLGMDRKKHPVGETYEGPDGYIYRMAEGGEENKISQQPSEAFNARQGRTTAQIAVATATEKPTTAERSDFLDYKKSTRGLGEGLASMNRALAANALSFEGTFASLASGAARLTGLNKEELAATSVLRTALGEAALGALKATFPGAISNDERKALDELYARARTATRDERIAIIGEIQQWMTNKLAESNDVVQSYQQQYPAFFDTKYIDAITQARIAINRDKKPREAVIQRLKELGYTIPGDL